MLRILCLTLLLCPGLSFAQPAPLSPGDVAPAFSVDRFYLPDNQSAPASLSAYRGKTLIIHFLATTCSSCIASVNHYPPLLRRFGDSLAVILVTSEKDDRVAKFLSKHPNYFGALPVISNDTTLKALFPFEYISHLVWINPAGKVAAITGTQYVTEKNIETVLHGEIPSWPVKKDLVGFNTAEKFLRLNDNNLPYSSLPASSSYSAFFSHMPDLPVGRYESVDSLAGTVKTSLINLTVPELYVAAQKLYDIPFSARLVDTQQPDYFFYDKTKYFKPEWDLLNTYTYEVVTPLTLSPAQRAARIKADLDFYLGTFAMVKDTLVKAWVLIDSGKASKPLLTEKIPGKSVALQSIIANANNAYNVMPYVDGRNTTPDRFIEIDPARIPDFAYLQKVLSTYGLALVSRLSTIRALVITLLDPQKFNHSLKTALK